MIPNVLLSYFSRLELKVDTALEHRVESLDNAYSQDTLVKRFF